MLSPPSRMWSPTARRSSDSSPSWAPTRMRLKSRGATAYVHHQQHVAGLELLAPAVAHRLQPRVERRLRLLQQRHPGQAGLHRGLQRQIARGGVEARRHRHHHVLVRQLRLVAELRVPRLPQVLQEAGAGLHRRDLRHVSRRTPGEDGRAAIDGGVAQPALGRRHQPRGHLRPMAARQLADHQTLRRVPRQAQRAGRKLGGRRQVQEGRQQRLGLHRARRGQLRHRQHRLARAPAFLRVQGLPRQRRVRRAQVDADRVLRRHGSSTSAGASTLTSTLRGSSGSFTAPTTQPWCLSGPVQGPAPVTLPDN